MMKTKEAVIRAKKSTSQMESGGPNVILYPLTRSGPPSFFGQGFDPILYAEKFSELNPLEAE